MTAYKIAAICSSAMDKVLTRTIFLRELLPLTNPLKEKNMVELGTLVALTLHQFACQQRYISSLRKVSSLSKAAKCLLFCLLRTFYPVKSCSPLATLNSSPLVIEGGKV